MNSSLFCVVINLHIIILTTFVLSRHSLNASIIIIVILHISYKISRQGYILLTWRVMKNRGKMKMIYLFMNLGDWVIFMSRKSTEIQRSGTLCVCARVCIILKLGGNCPYKGMKGRTTSLHSALCLRRTQMSHTAMDLPGKKKILKTLKKENIQLEKAFFLWM